LASNSFAAEPLKHTHSQPTCVPKTLWLAANDVAPADDRVRGIERENLNARAADDGANESAHRVNRWRLEQDEIPALARDRVESQVKARDVLLVGWNNAGSFHGSSVAPET